MVKLLPDEREDRDDFVVKIADLHSLEEARIPDAELARRKLNQEHVDSLVLSDPRRWPPIVVTLTDIGYVIIDGYHRREAALIKGMTEIRARSQNYQTEQEVIEATFQANLEHGLRASPESRSNYAYWLHKVYPKMEQKEIAARAGIAQSTVSIAIARRGKAATKSATAAKTDQEVPKPEAAARESQEEEQREHIRKDCQKLTSDAVRLLQDIETLDEKEQRAAIIEALATVEDRELLLRIAHLLEEVLQPVKRRPRR